jgi:hypothetical protein
MTTSATALTPIAPLTTTRKKQLMTTIALPARTTTSTRRALVRWLISFLGFPLGGFAALLLTGPVVDLTSAVGGGILTGAVLGAAQAWALRADRRLLVSWTLATTIGTAVGLAAGATLVAFSTNLADLALQGAVCGLAVGLAQAVVLRRRLGRLALAWPGYLAAAWALGWTVTTLAGIGVDAQFTVFGASGALVVALLTTLLPLALRVRDASTARDAA